MKVDDDAQVRLVNDLQWEAAHAVLLVSPESEVRTRQGSDEAPSTVPFDLPFVTCKLPKAALLASWEIPPFRDADRVARVGRAFERFDEWDLQRRT